MPHATLKDWLEHLEQAHPRSIDLGLERVGEVYRRLQSPRPAPLCIVVGGTNGKGSTVAMLDACLRAGGLRCGRYTSPHLLRYNERVVIDGHGVSDSALVDAFERIEAARGEISLSYFEFGTLAALLLFADADLDAAVLEVGLGGRLDAVNLVDGDASVLTTIDLDHQEYLGSDRAQIGWEKAHIARAARPLIVAAAEPPQRMLDLIAERGAECLLLDQELDFAELAGGRWRCRLPDGMDLDLPLPALAAPCQLRNAAAAVLTLWSLRQRWPFRVEALAAGMREVQLPGRLQRLPRAIESWVDVAHNPESARALAQWLQRQPPRHCVALYAALGDKDVEAMVAPLTHVFSNWLVLDLRSSSPRACAPELLAQRLVVVLPSDVAVDACAHIEAALEQGDRLAGAAGRLVIFGSFFTVALALQVVAEPAAAAAVPD